MSNSESCSEIVEIMGDYLDDLLKMYPDDQEVVKAVHELMMNKLIYSLL